MFQQTYIDLSSSKAQTKTHLDSNGKFVSNDFLKLKTLSFQDGQIKKKSAI